MALQEVERLLQLFHGAIERRRQKKHAKRPRMPGVMDPDADAVLPTLILFDAAAVIVADVRGADWHVISPTEDLPEPGNRRVALNRAHRVGYQVARKKDPSV